MPSDKVRHVLYERFLEQMIFVPVETVFVDLWYLDQSHTNRSREQRRNVLAGALIRRNFVPDARTALDVADLWMRLRTVYELGNLSKVLDLADLIQEYAQRWALA